MDVVRIAFFLSYSYTSIGISGNGCANRERLRERLRKKSDIFLPFILRECINFASENNKNLKET